MNFYSISLLVSLAIKFSFCSEHPRMVMYFDYEGSPKDAFKSIRKVLESEGFKILKYAPEDGFLFTDYKEFNWGTGRRIIAVTAHVHDKIVVTGMGSMDIPVSDLGRPEDLLKIKKMDRLPYLVQKKIFLSLTQPFADVGLVRIYN